MKYPSAKSAGFAALTGGVIALLAAATAIAPPILRAYVITGAALAAALILWIWFGTWYEFKDTYLLLRFGPFFERIPYAKITRAEKFHAMFSSMALSSDMIELTHGNHFLSGTTYISPKDRDGFLEELRKRCDHLQP